MMKSSAHLDELLKAEHGSVNIQVVFCDIVKYSRRKSVVQKLLIETFTQLVGRALNEISQKYVAYAQQRETNFATDIIRVPTGDGIAVVFTFDGLQRIALDFAEMLLVCIHEHNQKSECEKYTKEGWCNCHSSFAVRIGISEGKGIIYKDVNENYNVAGVAINLASRIMALGDGMQILLSSEAYQNLIDMTNELGLEDAFLPFPDIEVKHGIKINVYQYRPSNKISVNGSEPEFLQLNRQFEEMRALMPGLGLGDTSPKSLASKMETVKKMVGFLRELSSLAPEHPPDLGRLSGIHALAEKQHRSED